MNSTSEREGGSDKETDSASEREGGSEDIWQEMIGFNGDGMYAVVTPTDALPVTSHGHIKHPNCSKNICSTKGKEEDLCNQSHFEDCMP
jgi:hypothetical protein